MSDALDELEEIAAETYDNDHEATLAAQEYICIFFDNGVCSHASKKPWPGEVTPTFCKECEERVSPNPPRI